LETIAKAYKLLKKIKDEKFDVDQLHHYNLNLLIGNRDFQVLVVDPRSQRCLLLEDYIITNISSYSKLVTVFEEIFDNHHLLKAGFWSKVSVGIKGNKFSLVPQSLFDKNLIFDYLKFNSKVDREFDELLYYVHEVPGAVNNFAIDKRLYSWLKTLYPKKEITYYHQSSALIEGTLQQLDKHPEDSIYVYIDRFKLHITTSKDGKLEYYNQFYVKQFADYIKYIMTVLKGLDRDQRKTNVVLWGYLGSKSKHFNEFGKYIKNIELGERVTGLKFGYLFDDVQDHQYFDLYSTTLIN
jgi:hypothetical protein